MDFEFGVLVIRERRVLVLDQYSGAMVPGDWASVESQTIDGAFVASSSSSAVQSATRTEVLTTKSLFCDPAADVRVGDRIRSGPAVYQIDAKPEADINPFTGWSPVQEIPLEEVSG